MCFNSAMRRCFSSPMRHDSPTRRNSPGVIFSPERRGFAIVDAHQGTTVVLDCRPPGPLPFHPASGAFGPRYPTERVPSRGRFLFRLTSLRLEVGRPAAAVWTAGPQVLSPTTPIGGFGPEVSNGKSAISRAVSFPPYVVRGWGRGGRASGCSCLGAMALLQGLREVGPCCSLGTPCSRMRLAQLARAAGRLAAGVEQIREQGQPLIRFGQTR